MWRWSRWPVPRCKGSKNFKSLFFYGMFLFIFYIFLNFSLPYFTYFHKTNGLQCLHWWRCASVASFSMVKVVAVCLGGLHGLQCLGGLHAYLHHLGPTRDHLSARARRGIKQHNTLCHFF